MQNGNNSIFNRAFFLTIIQLCCLGIAAGQSSGCGIKIFPLQKDFYIYTTCNVFKNVAVPANGMYVVTSAGVVLFDTPWDTAQFQPLLDSIAYKHHKKVILSVSTHFHEDRTIGLDFLKQHGVKTYTTRMTDSISAKRGEKRAAYLIDTDTTFIVGDHSFQTFYPGKGHSPDNIVIWFNNEKILYGGCFIKSVEATDAGNLSDADIDAWYYSLVKLQRKFQHPRFIIPGHQDWQNKASLQHTLDLIIDAREKQRSKNP